MRRVVLLDPLLSSWLQEGEMTELATLEPESWPSPSEEDTDGGGEGAVWGRLFPVGRGFVLQGVCTP